MSSGIMSKATRACIVREALCDGLGVEDIAVQWGISLQSVRYEVQELRALGLLKRLFPKPDGRVMK